MATGSAARIIRQIIHSTVGQGGGRGRGKGKQKGREEEEEQTILGIACVYVPTTHHRHRCTCMYMCSSLWLEYYILVRILSHMWLIALATQ